MTAPEGSNLVQRAGFAVGVRIGRVLRAVHYQRHPLQVIPQLGPWFMTYGHDGGMDATGVRINAATCEANVSGGFRGHPGLIVGVRWRRPSVMDRSWSRQFTPKVPQIAHRAFVRVLYGKRQRPRGMRTP